MRFDPAQWKRSEGVLVIVNGQSDLFQVVGALDAAGGLARGLYSGQKQGDQYSNNRDHDQEFDEGKRVTTVV